MKSFDRIFTKHLMALAALAILVFAALGCVEIKSDDEWKRELGGKKLSMAKTSDAFNDKVEIRLCPSGEFERRSEFSGYSAISNRAHSTPEEIVEKGKWWIESGRLFLLPKSNTISQYDLSQISGRVIKLSGDSYLVENYNECR